MSALRKINKKAFPSGVNRLVGRDVVIYTATPNAAVTGRRVGQLCWDKTNSNAYICTALPSTWVKINA
jgi:hypothetical protein